MGTYSIRRIFCRNYEPEIGKYSVRRILCSNYWPEIGNYSVRLIFYSNYWPKIGKYSVRRIFCSNYWSQIGKYIVGCTITCGNDGRRGEKEREGVVAVQEPIPNTSRAISCRSNVAPMTICGRAERVMPRLPFCQSPRRVDNG